MNITNIESRKQLKQKKRGCVGIYIEWKPLLLGTLGMMYRIHSTRVPTVGYVAPVPLLTFLTRDSLTQIRPALIFSTLATVN